MKQQTALETGIEGLFPSLVNYRGEYKGVDEVLQARDRLYKLRNHSWTLTVGPKLGLMDTNAACESLGAKISELADVAQVRIGELNTKTEKKLSTFSDSGHRATLAQTAAGICRGAVNVIILQLGRAISGRNLNLAREILLQAKSEGKITGKESGYEKAFFAVLGLPSLYEAISQWEEFAEEVRVYQDAAIDSSAKIARGQRGTLLSFISSLKFTDPVAFNQVLSAETGVPNPAYRGGRPC